MAVFAPNPLMTVTLEVEGPSDGRQSIHFHAGGQGVWASGMAHTMGIEPVLVGLIGGEVGEVLRPLLASATSGPAHLVQSAAASGCYITDRRSGERELVAMTLSDPPSRHELDELVSLTCAEALACGWLLLTNPLPGEALPLEVYGDLVANARSGGCTTLVDLSPPRLNSALRGRPEIVKVNDWELAEYVRGPVSTPDLLLEGAARLQRAGAGCVIVTRGEQPALVLDGERALQLVPPHFEHGFREGCGDAMMGALAAGLAQGRSLERSLVLGAAAGAANFLRRGLGHASREVVEELAGAVQLGPWPDRAAT
ncbi:MAG TPA: PfkB family carbohydrate kinase [Solirubrobacteraceae bacterium]|nr:PfkB family carbohydrate kinase [Solirubrobacteraceae bacterium]